VRLRKLILMVVTLGTSVILLASCAAPSVQPAPEQAAPTPPPTPEPTPPTEPTGIATPIPKKILTSHFGFVGAGIDYRGVRELGIKWDRTVAGGNSFVWGRIEPEPGNYVWEEVDSHVRRVQRHGFGILVVVWPFAEWDQANWGPPGTEPLTREDHLGRGRRKPYDTEAYKKFVRALVERYDGDGIDDMPDLRYPIKYWEACSEPDLQSDYWTYFSGSPEDYLEVLRATYESVKRADPEAKVLHAALAGMKDYSVSFWEPIFEKGSQYFDIANIHSIGASEELNAPEFRKLLSKYGIDKPIWVTEAQHPAGKIPGIIPKNVSLDEQARIMVKSYAIAFACGVDKVFYTSFSPPPSAYGPLRQAALIDENGKRPAYYALKTLIQKLESFTSAEKLAEGRYRFMVEGQAVYVLWRSGKIPKEITGDVSVTDIHGNETRVNSSEISLTENPIFVEQYPR